MLSLITFADESYGIVFFVGEETKIFDVCFQGFFVDSVRLVGFGNRVGVFMLLLEWLFERFEKMSREELQLSSVCMKFTCTWGGVSSAFMIKVCGNSSER